jgi:hypothetical protein
MSIDVEILKYWIVNTMFLDGPLTLREIVREVRSLNLDIGEDWIVEFLERISNPQYQILEKGVSDFGVVYLRGPMYEGHNNLKVEIVNYIDCARMHALLIIVQNEDLKFELIDRRIKVLKQPREMKESSLRLTLDVMRIIELKTLEDLRGEENGSTTS